MGKIKDDNIHKGHRERLKQRFLNEGLKNFEEHNVLELLLFYAIPYKDTNDLAHILINKFGSLKSVFDAPYEELVKVKGINEHSAILLKLMSPLAYKYYTDKDQKGMVFESLHDIGEYCVKQFIGCKRERVLLLALDCNNRLIYQKVLSEGGLSSVSFDARGVIEAVIVSDAFAVVLAHNHPTFNALPSNDDLIATLGMKRVLETSKVFLKEHFIISGDEYTGIETQVSGKFSPPDPDATEEELAETEGEISANESELNETEGETTANDSVAVADECETVITDCKSEITD